MKLLQINVSANLGSTGRIAEQIGLAAMKQGWESYIAYGRNTDKSASRLIKIGNIFGLATHLLYSRLTGRHGLASVYATKKLVKQIKTIQPDIIHLHNIHGYYINYKILFEYLNSTDIPLVWTLHDCWSFTGHCAHFIHQQCYKWKEQCMECPYRRVYPKAYIDSSKRNYDLKKFLYTNNRNMHIVPVSHWLLDFVTHSILQDKHLQVIHNGVDIAKYKPNDISENHPEIRVLGVASQWTKSKGLYDFYDLRKRFDEKELTITLVGLTKQQIAELPKGIKGIQRTNSMGELAALYADADVFINPTYADTFPTTNLEALACGTPVITYLTGGSPEAVTPETGFVVEQGDLDGVVQAIEEIGKYGKEHYAAACRKRAEEHFDKGKCFQKYIDLYEEILSKK